MAITTKKSPWEKEWADLEKKEAKFTQKRKEGPTSVLMQKLDKLVPKKLSETLNTAFYKAFALVFEKGTGIIEKTYNKEKKETDFKVNTYAIEISDSRKAARAFTKKAKSAKGLNLLVSGVEGVGMGLVGGVFDPIYVNRISDYAVLKYRRRFLEGKLKHEE